MTATNPDRHLQAFIDALYAEAADADPLGILTPLCASLRQYLRFTTASFIEVQAPDWVMASCHIHDIGADGCVRLCGDHRGLAAARIGLPGLKHPNQVIGIGECLDLAQLPADRLGEDLRRLVALRGLALVPFVRGIPIGVFGLHRPMETPEFDREERALFRWHATQAARALDYRRLVERVERGGPAILIVAPTENRLISLTDEAQALLDALPGGETLSLPADAQHCAVWVLGNRTYVVRAMHFLPDLILSTGAIGNLSLNRASAATNSKLRFFQGSTQRRALVLIEPMEQAIQAHCRLSGFGLTPRQEEVAMMLALGKQVKNIARACGISANTAKEHVADVYQRLGVHTREALVAKLSGAA